MTIVRSLLIPAALAAAIIVPAGAFAQQSAQQPTATAPTHGQWEGRHRHGGMMGMMRDLNLTDAQKTQIQQIFKQFRDSRTPGERPDAQARAQLHEKIMSVLTPQQRTQLQAKMQQMRQERDERAEPAPESTPEA